MPLPRGARHAPAHALYVAHEPTRQPADGADARGSPCAWPRHQAAAAAARAALAGAAPTTTAAHDIAHRRRAGATTKGGRRPALDCAGLDLEVALNGDNIVSRCRLAVGGRSTHVCFVGRWVLALASPNLIQFNGLIKENHQPAELPGSRLQGCRSRWHRNIFRSLPSSHAPTASGVPPIHAVPVDRNGPCKSRLGYFVDRE